MSIIPSTLPAGGWDTPQGLAVFLLALVLAFAIAGHAVAHWWAPVLWRRRENRDARHSTFIIIVRPQHPASSASSAVDRDEAA